MNEVDKIIEGLGIPKAVFTGPGDSNYSSRLQNLEELERKAQHWLEAIRKNFEERTLSLMIQDMVNPLEFFYLFPLGKKAKVRKNHKVKPYTITWGVPVMQKIAARIIGSV